MKYNLSNSMADRMNFDEAIYRTITEQGDETAEYLRTLSYNEAARQILELAGIADEVDDLKEAIARTQSVVEKEIYHV